MKTVRFHEAAQQELAKEVLCFAAISSRLGGRFVAAVEATVRPALRVPRCRIAQSVQDATGIPEELPLFDHLC